MLNRIVANISEKLSPIKSISILGKENLDAVIQRNHRGKRVIFSPNHLIPQGMHADLRKNMAFAEDHFVFDKLLKQHNLKSRVVARGDADMEIGDSKINKLKYDFHRKIFSLFVKSATGGIPIAINAKESAYATKVNEAAKDEMMNTKENITIYPYGNWFESGSQNFSKNEDLNNEDKFVSKSNFEDWRISLKKGFIEVAMQTNDPIVPVYVENNNGEWKINIGKPIYTSFDESNVELAKKYLDAMQKLKIEAKKG